MHACSVHFLLRLLDRYESAGGVCFSAYVYCSLLSCHNGIVTSSPRVNYRYAQIRASTTKEPKLRDHKSFNKNKINYLVRGTKQIATPPVAQTASATNVDH